MAKVELLIKLHNYIDVVCTCVHVGMPLFVSKPHCLDCDPEYFMNVSGYHPIRKLHDPYSGIEPVSNSCDHIDTLTHTYTHIQYTYTHIHAHTCACVYTCTHAYAHVYTHIHTHTHTHAHM